MLKEWLIIVAIVLAYASLLVVGAELAPWIFVFSAGVVALLLFVRWSQIRRIWSQMRRTRRPTTPEAEEQPPSQDQSAGESEQADSPFPYEAIVEIEDMFALGKDEVLREALLPIRDQLQGDIGIGLCFAQSHKLSMHMVRVFSLSEQGDFDLFSQAMMTVEGVVGVKKADGPWDTADIIQQTVDEIAAEKEQKAEEAFKERERQLAELKELEASQKAADEEKFGPEQPMTHIDRDRQQFTDFIGQIGRCEVEVRGAFSDMLAGGFLRYGRVVQEVATGPEAIAAFEAALNGKELRMPFAGDAHFAEIPFSVEYRKGLDRKKFVHLVVGSGKPTFIMAAFDLYIREL